MVQVDLMFFLMKEIQNRIATPLFWDHRQSMKWIFFEKDKLDILSFGKTVL